jgi:tetratricopeptide (TPR) repeat protein
VIGEGGEGAYGVRAREIAAELALHFERGRDVRRAVMYLQYAAENAVQRFAHAEAIATLQHALTQLTLLPAPEQEPLQLKISLQLAFSLSVLGRFRDILTLLLPQREVLERRPESAIAGPYYFRLSLTYSYLGEQEQAAEAADRAVWHAQQCGDTATMGQAHYVLALRGYWLGEPQAGILHGRQAVYLLSGASERNWLGLSQWILGLNYLFLGESAPALAAEAEAARLAEELQDPRLQSFAAWSIGWIQAAHGEWEDGIARCQHGVACAPDPVSVAAATSALGYAYLESGDTHQAIFHLEEALGQLLHLRLRQSEGRISAWLSDAYLLAGRSDEAQELATRSLAISREVNAQYGIAWAQRVLGKIARTRASFAEAESHLSEALQTFTAMTARFEMGRTHLLFAELAHASGNCTAATAHLHDAWQLFAALPVKKYVERTEQIAEKWGASLCEPQLTPP